MEPEFHDGQIAWVLQQESVANEEISIFTLNGEAYIKKLQNDKDGIFLISLNEKYAPIKVGENDRLDIFGKVLGKSDASSFCLRLFSYGTLGNSVTFVIFFFCMILFTVFIYKG